MVIKANIIYETTHPAYAKLQEIGKEITTGIKPRALVVVSAHWQPERDTVEVNVEERGELIYEYVSFVLAGWLSAQHHELK